MVQRTKRGETERRKASASDRKETISFDYVKSNLFRVISVNGIVGGITPNGDIHMAVWNQRAPYPQQVVHAVTEEGVLGDETSRKRRDADLIREIEAGLVFNEEMARVTIKWLEGRLEEISKLKVTTKDQKGTQ